MENPFRTKRGENQIIWFKHNRFNLVFLLGKSVYNHHKDIPLFLETVHGTCTALLKAVALDGKETLYIAGSSWANFYIYNCPITETVGGKGHILDMNAKYKILVDFLQKAATDAEVASSLATGEQTPFNTSIEEVFENCLKGFEIFN